MRNKTSNDDFQAIFDPALEASCAWFVQQMYQASDVEKVVLVHLVVEVAAVYSYKYIKPTLADEATQEHFELHSVLDDEHVQMGYTFIEQAALSHPQALLDIQEKGWAMMSLLMVRLADLTDEVATAT